MSIRAGEKAKRRGGENRRRQAIGDRRQTAVTGPGAELNWTKGAARWYRANLSTVPNGGMRYQDLVVWKRAMQLAESVYGLTRLLPADERFGLVTQMRRSARSVPANIAEGYGRGKTGEYLMFVSYAIGSAFELQTDLDLVVRLGLLSQEQVQPAAKSALEVAKMLVSLRSKIRP